MKEKKERVLGEGVAEVRVKKGAARVRSFSTLIKTLVNYFLAPSAL